jgi:hypothetical protein
MLNNDLVNNIKQLLSEHEEPKCKIVIQLGIGYQYGTITIHSKSQEPIQALSTQLGWEMRETDNGYGIALELNGAEANNKCRRIYEAIKLDLANDKNLSINFSETTYR